MKHELWIDSDGLTLFSLSSSRGDDARKIFFAEVKEENKTVKMVWTCEASSHFEAMTKYYEYMGWGEWTTDFPDIDKQTYKSLGWE